MSFFKSLKFRILVICLAVCILVGATAWIIAARPKAPQVEEIYDRVVELIEDSYALNTVFWGAGLPVYAADSTFAEFTHMYYSFSQKEYYEIVTEEAAFHSEEEICKAAELVFGTEYLESVIYPAAFVGYAIDDSMGDAAYAYARYMLQSEYFCQSTAKDDNYLKFGMRIYDYSSMQVIKPSTANACKVSINSWLEDSPDEQKSVILNLVKQDGNWYLDSFSG